MKKLLFLSLIFIAISCSTKSVRLPDDVIDKQIPSIAVLDFENKAKFSYTWDIGRGIRDSLVDELVRSQRYKVITRQNIDAVIAELSMQQNKLFRKEGKAPVGKLKNVKYLLKGSVTDFAHVAGSGIRAFFSSIGLSATGDLAIVTVTLYVIDVESGEIIASKQVEGKAYASSIDVRGQYKNVRFGTGSFYRTPLGKACKDLIGEALKELANSIAADKWNPKVVTAGVDEVIISGGINRGLEIGMQWAAFEKGQTLLDPETGDVLGFERSTQQGEIEVIKIHDKYSICKTLKGNFRRGQILRRIIREAKQIAPKKTH